MNLVSSKYHSVQTCETERFSSLGCPRLCIRSLCVNLRYWAVLLVGLSQTLYSFTLYKLAQLSGSPRWAVPDSACWHFSLVNFQLMCIVHLSWSDQLEEELSEEWKVFFKKLGIRKSDLRDKETARLIYDAIGSETGKSVIYSKPAASGQTELTTT